jgi:hypothetical protein
MWKRHTGVTGPKDRNVRIWRYMDFTKSVSLLETSSLFFARADLLEDPFEGSITKVHLGERKGFFQRIRKSGFPEESIVQLGLDEPDLSKSWRKSVFVNSWHMNKHESVAMWKLYLKTNEGIAIQSTYSGLKESFRVNPKDEVHIGQVEYIDYDRDFVWKRGFFVPFLHKRKSFEHERELRCVVHNVDIARAVHMGKEPDEKGIYVTVDLDVLIDKVYVAPGAPEWFCRLVTSIVPRYGLKKEIETSALDSRPLF